MARALPNGWEQLDAQGLTGRRQETLRRLARDLPDAYTVYHAVHWTRLEGEDAVFGEADFIIVNRAGDLLIIEQKNGLLLEEGTALLKHDGRTRQQVAVRMATTRSRLAARLQARPGCRDVRVDMLLYCPDHVVREAQTAGLVPERIVDAASPDSCSRRVLALLPAGRESAATAQVHRFLQDLVALEPDVSALLQRADVLLTRVSGGLTHWARCLELEPFRLRVIGTAGSGKSQLALAEYRACLAAGGRPLYLCFNRPLADHFARIVPPGGQVASLHHWCDERLRTAGRRWDYGQQDAFDGLVAAAAALPPGSHELFDTVIIDEGQDFTQAWAGQVLRHARAGARLLWLEDPMQNLYGRPDVTLPGWAILHARENYRTPLPILRVLQSLLARAGRTDEIRARCPLPGEPVELLVYRDETELLQRSREALRLCWSAGYRAEDTVLLSFHGRQHSAILRLPRLGPESLRSFSGRYDLFGVPAYSRGEVLAESVHRFKGQSAPAVVLTEIDCAALDMASLRRLFVGITRARLKLVLVASVAAASHFSDALG